MLLWYFFFPLFFSESKLKAVTDAAGNYHEVLKENHKLFNELQDLKGAYKLLLPSGFYVFVYLLLLIFLNFLQGTLEYIVE